MKSLNEIRDQLANKYKSDFHDVRKIACLIGFDLAVTHMQKEIAELFVMLNNDQIGRIDFIAMVARMFDQSDGGK